LVSAAVATTILAVGTPATALDHPSAGTTLKLSNKNGKQKLVFISKDGGSLFPAIGSADDPATAGAVIDLAPSPGGAGTLAMPPGSGNPGWTAKNTALPAHKFQNKFAPAGISGVKVAFFKQGKQIKVIAKSLGGTSFGPTTTQVGVRVTTGSLRNCALFGPETIRRTSVEALSAAKAPPSALADCSNASIGFPGGCQLSEFPACGGACEGDEVCTPQLGSCACVGPSTPCGASYPACGGVCPVGEACAAIGPDHMSCLCIPEGATPCGDPGAPTCGGACPSGQACFPAYGLPALGGQLGCTCGSPAACGAGGLDCGNGLVCVYFGSSTLCAPIPCGGTYPTCGNTACGDGGECQAINVNAGAFTGCVCAVPASCDTCGGYSCPSGQVCGIQAGGPGPTTCGCE
jgi:hypothetical protein